MQTNNKKTIDFVRSQWMQRFTGASLLHVRPTKILIQHNQRSAGQINAA